MITAVITPYEQLVCAGQWAKHFLWIIFLLLQNIFEADTIISTHLHVRKREIRETSHFSKFSLWKKIVFPQSLNTRRTQVKRYT